MNSPIEKNNKIINKNDLFALHFPHQKQTRRITFRTRTPASLISNGIDKRATKSVQVRNSRHPL